MFLIVSIFTLFIGLGFFFMKKRYSYWKNKGVNGPDPLPIIGNFANVIFMRDSAQSVCNSIYQKYSDEKVVGLYRGFTPVLQIQDPDLIKQITIKDFNFFQDRGIKSISGLLSENLFSSEGETWRILRQKMTPTFTTKKLKDMSPLIKECIKEFVRHVEHLDERNIDCEIKALVAKYNFDMISSCGFGMSLDVYSDQRNVLKEMADKLLFPSYPSRLLVMLNMVIPGIRRMIKLPSLIKIENFFVDFVKNIMSERKGKRSFRNDFIGIMTDLREQGRASRKDELGTVDIEITDELITAQAVVFYTAGFESASATMSFLFYELALNQQIQDKVYNEICAVYKKYDGEITYESVKEMRYLKMVVDETLRRYDIAGLILRICTEDYTFQDINLTIEKGTPIFIVPAGLHSSPKYFVYPNEFNPENFSDENLKKIPPYVYVPFGLGPRNCIGMRFAEIQTMMGAAAFLKNFKVEPSSKTKKQLKFIPTAPILTSTDGIWLKITKRQNNS